MPPAARQHGGLLLLLLYTAASRVPGMQARPIDFVCDDQARRDMNTVQELEASMGECHGSALLPSPITLPCVKTHKASWDMKSKQEKRGDIVAALRTLSQGVKEVRLSPLSECQAPLLEKLERSVTNYLHIVTHLELTGEGNRSVTACPSQPSQNLSLVLWNFSRLLTGKLEWLAAELTSQCKQATSQL
ncbi:thrombopoietin [Conger conger]|uniref:thrombopoietin n=1 Tax=Conger conger TaxID=82655 RepID=UPI002A5A06A5|nr:thrombopoietin [Conger conger]